MKYGQNVEETRKLEKTVLKTQKDNPIVVTAGTDTNLQVDRPPTFSFTEKASFEKEDQPENKTAFLGDAACIFIAHFRYHYDACSLLLYREMERKDEAEGTPAEKKFT
ncbi:hypothetical protein HK097_006505 [Rhizophlyctis rosea]|uniref:Uncharacterized protein n=1 Tax=Rhizophlyctis rosea TaxID=64517 RepID=A0AAD5X2T2_9FUNG|nr:hypothetical protein HK097_006505 [Rhizophlyctis rosea]